MPLIIAIITIISVFSAFLANFDGKDLNSVVAFFLYEFSLVKSAVFLFIFGALVLTFIYLRSVKFAQNYSGKKKFFFSLLQVAEALITGTFFSYVILFCIALLELNIISLILNLNPGFLGVLTGNGAVVSALKTNSKPPEIIIAQNRAGRDVLAVASAVSGRDNFYGNFLLPAVPGFLILPSKNSGSGFYLIDNSLVVRSLDPADLKVVGPAVSYSLLRYYFYGRSIKPPPVVSFMDAVEYKKFREMDFNKNFSDLDRENKKLSAQISSSSAKVKDYKTKIAKNEALVKNSTVSRDKEYKNCLSDGTYKLDYCKSLLEKWNKTIDPAALDLSAWQLSLGSASALLKSSENDLKISEVLQKSIKAAENNIPRETGAFNPPATIKIAFNLNDPAAVADYFETLVHENLHYASYVSDTKKFADVFMEEGLTEYFARAIIKDDLNFDTNIGYPVYAKIITQMTKNISQRDLEDLYFTKDQEGLENLLNRVYGDNFYKNNRLSFLIIQYSNSPAQTLKVANEIMKKIGGDPLKEKDLYATRYNQRQ